MQAACLEFLAGILNLKEGSLSDSVHPADAAARATWALLLDFEEDVRKRCERDKVVAPHAPLLKEKLKEGLGAALEGVCAKIGGAAAHAHRPGIGQAPKQPSAPFLSLIYASRAFRQWWLTEKSEASQEEQMIIKYREFDLNLTDHVADHRRALHLVEKTLLEALDEASSRALAEATARFGIPALATSTPPRPVSKDALVSLMTAADAAHTAATPTVQTGGAKPPASASPMSAARAALGAAAAATKPPPKPATAPAPRFPSTASTCSNSPPPSSWRSTVPPTTRCPRARPTPWRSPATPARATASSRARSVESFNWPVT